MPERNFPNDEELRASVPADQAAPTDAVASSDQAAPTDAAASSDQAAPVAHLPAYLEALLFAAPTAVTPAQLAAALDLPTPQIEQGLAELEAIYTQEGPARGLRLQRHRGRVQLTTAPQLGPVVEKFLGLEISGRLSRAALETLAIVLYRQPVTRPQIDAIRGVNSDGVMKSLLNRGLVQEVGRADAPGRPILYSATSECLQYFGLSSLAELPPLDLDGGESAPLLKE